MNALQTPKNISHPQAPFNVNLIKNYRFLSENGPCVSSTRIERRCMFAKASREGFSHMKMIEIYVVQNFPDRFLISIFCECFLENNFFSKKIAVFENPQINDFKSKNIFEKYFSKIFLKSMIKNISEHSLLDKQLFTKRGQFTHGVGQ